MEEKDFIYDALTIEQLEKLSVTAPDEQIRTAAKEHWDAIAKPLDGLGVFEQLIADIAAIQGRVRPKISRRVLLILCADHGIVEEGVSQCGSHVTRLVAENMGKELSSVGRMAKRSGVDTCPVDLGILGRERIEGVLDRKIREGSRNFIKEPALTGKEVLVAIQTGIRLVWEKKMQGYDMLALGEMGIGNTTSSAAVCAALLGLEASEVTSRGAGLSDEGLDRKIAVIQKAVEKYDLGNRSAFEVLCDVGGLEIAGLCGVCIAGALYRMPVVLDGVITMTAALAAERLCPGVREYLLASHIGKEKACGLLAKALDLKPVIDAGMKLGEGTGAVMLFPLLDMTEAVYENGGSFDELTIRPYERYGK